MTASRRHDRLGVHSIGEFGLVVPSLAEAEKFYSAFGLCTERDRSGLTLRAQGSDHIWGRLCEGPNKKLARLSFHCFEDEADKLYTHILSHGVERLPPPADGDDAGIWFKDPDGLLVQVRPGPEDHDRQFPPPQPPASRGRNAVRAVLQPGAARIAAAAFACGAHDPVRSLAARLLYPCTRVATVRPQR